MERWAVTVRPVAAETWSPFWTILNSKLFRATVFGQAGLDLDSAITINAC